MQVELVILPRSIINETPPEQQNQQPPPPPPPQNQDSGEEEQNEEEDPYFKKSLKKLWSQPGRTQIQMTRDFFGLGGVAIPPFSPFCFHSPSPSHFAFLFLTP